MSEDGSKNASHQRGQSRQENLIGLQEENDDEDDDDFEESNANLSNDDDARAEAVIASSPAFSREF